MVQHVEKAYYRFVLLFFNCLMTLGPYFCSDIPSVLQNQFQGNLTCPNTTVINGTIDCVLGLGMTPQQYNLLHAVLSWMNALASVVAGFLIDKFGNCFGVFVSSSLCVLGSSLFALGSHFTGTPYLLPLMLTGRLLFGSGSGSLSVVQNRITAFWFKEKELGMAYGLTLTLTRLGSVLNFFLTQRFEEEYGMQWTLWGGTLLCVLSFLAAIVVCKMDTLWLKRQRLVGSIQEESRKVRILDVKLLPLSYWLLVLTILFFYNGIFPFIADACKFIQDKYSGYSQKEAAYIASAVYDSSLVLLVTLGILIDYVGLRGIFAVSCAVLTLPAFGLLAFTYVPPLISTAWLGITYSFACVSMWASIPLVVPQVTLGTAIGLAVSIEMLGVGVSNLVIGSILGTTSSEAKIPLWRWQRMMIFMLSNIMSCIIASVLLNIVDHRQGGTLNKSTKRTSQQNEAENSKILPVQKKTLHLKSSCFMISHLESICSLNCMAESLDSMTMSGLLNLNSLGRICGSSHSNEMVVLDRVKRKNSVRRMSIIEDGEIAEVLYLIPKQSMMQQLPFLNPNDYILCEKLASIPAEMSGNEWFTFLYHRYVKNVLH
ncbi:lysosomal dipeptide transporter MFSD1-like [Antennarius striatus]|uniref:lysosomal dipeptide transporter MFSD1-like n=1 Tax=Antennarius striatus TaxID=241820 RepID=UPI0035B2BE3A